MRRELVWASMVLMLALSAEWSYADSENILLYRAGTGEGIVGQLQGDKLKKLRQYGPGEFAQWTDIVVSKLPHELLFYNRPNGVWTIGELDHGKFVTKQDARADFSKGWTSFVRIPTVSTFFYNRVSGEAVLGYAPTIKTYKPGELLSGWTHVVANRSGMLFYNAQNGAGAVAIYTGRIGFGSGPTAIKTVADYAPGKFSSGWTHLVATPTEFLFYNSADGSGAIGRFVGNGDDLRFETTQNLAKGSFSSHWSDVVATPEGNTIVFYQEATGLAALGELSNGQFKTTRQFAKDEFGAGWTHVATTGPNSQPQPPIR